MKSVKVTVMSKKGRHFFQENINRGDTTAELIDRQTVMTKKVVSFFRKKIGVTPSVATRGDINPSDATALPLQTLVYQLCKCCFTYLYGLT